MPKPLERTAADVTPPDDATGSQGDKLHASGACNRVGKLSDLLEGEALDRPQVEPLAPPNPRPPGTALDVGQQWVRW